MPLRLVGPNSAPVLHAFSPEALAREFARAHGRRVRRRWLLAATDAGSAECFTVSVRTDRLTMRLTCDGPRVEAETDRHLPPGMQCSIGAPVAHETRPSRFVAGRRGEHPVFVTRLRAERVPELLASDALLAALDALALGEGESLQTVYGVGFVLFRPDAARVAAAFGAAAGLAEAIRTPTGVPVAPRCPQALRPISELIAEWGVTDPHLRAARVADAHPDALARLLGSARHYAQKVERFLARTRSPDSDIARQVSAFRDAAALAEVRMRGVTDLRAPRRQGGRHGGE